MGAGPQTSRVGPCLPLSGGPQGLQKRGPQCGQLQGPSQQAVQQRGLHLVHVVEGDGVPGAQRRLLAAWLPSRVTDISAGEGLGLGVPVVHVVQGHSQRAVDVEQLRRSGQLVVKARGPVEAGREGQLQGHREALGEHYAGVVQRPLVRGRAAPPQGLTAGPHCGPAGRHQLHPEGGAGSSPAHWRRYVPQRRQNHVGFGGQRDVHRLRARGTSSGPTRPYCDALQDTMEITTGTRCSLFAPPQHWRGQKPEITSKRGPNDCQQLHAPSR
mmetsp:Transcript_8744/g.13066  ORF Transcript_8744/g.13066 Transcript_8744/m.13066 type:complete len:270 (-) Transcript_8744:263-1072(-)